MATVYDIKIETVSELVNHTPEFIEKCLLEFLENKIDMVNTKIKVTEKIKIYEINN